MTTFNMNFPDIISENSKILNFMKILSVETEMFHEDRRKDRHDEANGRFSQFCEGA